MIHFVLDCSVAMSWCFEDEADHYSDRVLDALKEGDCVVPGLWPLEVANVLIIAERRKRLKEADSMRFVDLLQSLPVVMDDETPGRALGATLSIGRENGLTAYDAAYLELAMRRGLPLATRDKTLLAACKKSGVKVFSK